MEISPSVPSVDDSHFLDVETTLTLGNQSMNPPLFPNQLVEPGTTLPIGNPSMNPPPFPNQLAEPGIGENTYDFSTGSHVLNYSGLVDCQQHQQQSVIPDQIGENTYDFGTGSHVRNYSGLVDHQQYQQQSVIPDQGMVNVSNISMNHQVVLQPPGSSQALKQNNVDPKKLAKQHNDRKYREKKKAEMNDLKRKVDMLEKDENLMVGAQMEKALEQGKKDFLQLEGKHLQLEGKQETLSTIVKKILKTQTRIKKEMKKVKAKMMEISMQQRRCINNPGQKEAREKFEEREFLEYKQLKKETELISHAWDNLQLPLTIKYDILKALEENDLAKPASVKGKKAMEDYRLPGPIILDILEAQQKNDLAKPAPVKGKQANGDCPIVTEGN